MREQIRRTLYYYLNVYRGGEKEPLGMLADITLQGCLLLTEFPLREGERFALRVELPRGGALEEESLEFEGVVRWVKKDDLRPVYSAGILYTEKNETLERTVEKLVEHIGFSNGQKKIHLVRGDADFH